MTLPMFDARKFVKINWTSNSCRRAGGKPQPLVGMAPWVFQGSLETVTIRAPRAGNRTQQTAIIAHAPVRAAGYANARFRFSIASSTSAVFLKPTVTLSTPALLNANLMAACRS